MSPRAGQKGKRKIGLPKVSLVMLDPIYIGSIGLVASGNKDLEPREKLKC